MSNEHFFIVGAQRSGTTFLYNMLDKCDTICMAKPVFPEPKYFLNRKYNYLNYKSYLDTHFKHKKNEKILGEKGTSYIEHPETSILITKFLKKSKIIIALRNPVDRAISNYFFSLNNGLETRSIYDVFINQKPSPVYNRNTSVSPFDYIKRGQYIDYIQRYLKPFSNDQILICFFEEFTTKINSQKEILNFLGSRTHDFTFFDKVINSSKKITTVDPIIKKKLNEYYLPFNEKLSLHLNKDLSIWLE